MSLLECTNDTRPIVLYQNGKKSGNRWKEGESVNHYGEYCAADPRMTPDTPSDRPVAYTDYKENDQLTSWLNEKKMRRGPTHHSFAVPGQCYALERLPLSSGKTSSGE